MAGGPPFGLLHQPQVGLHRGRPRKRHLLAPALAFLGLPRLHLLSGSGRHLRPHPPALVVADPRQCPHSAGGEAGRRAVGEGDGIGAGDRRQLLFQQASGLQKEKTTHSAYPCAVLWPRAVCPLAIPGPYLRGADPRERHFVCRIWATTTGVSALWTS